MDGGCWRARVAETEAAPGSGLGEWYLWRVSPSSRPLCRASYWVRSVYPIAAIFAHSVAGFAVFTTGLTIFMLVRDRRRRSVNYSMIAASCTLLALSATVRSGLFETAVNLTSFCIFRSSPLTLTGLSEDSLLLVRISRAGPGYSSRA